MRGASTYVPKTAFAGWLDRRLPVLRWAQDALWSFPTPRNLNVWYTFGAILAFALGAQIATGIALAMHYVANTDLAFDSVESIMRDVNYGWLLRYAHATGASMIFLALYIHIFRSLYYGSYKAPRELLWILGVVLYVLMIATAFLGYTLPWGQMSYWGATVITNFVTSLNSVIPHLGTAIAEWLWGGFGIGDPTLNRFFSLHYLLPFVIAGVVGLHIWALHVAGNNNPVGIDVRAPQDTISFHPYYTVKDAFFVSCFLILYAVVVFYAPNFLINPDNYTPANPSVTPTHIVPEWYFLPFYAILRAFPKKLLGVVALLVSVATLFFVPWLDTSKVRSARFRPVYRMVFWILVADCGLLGYIGAQPADAAWQLGSIELPLVWLGRLATLYYFAHFWIVMPIVGRFEKTTRPPASIGDSVPSTGPVKEAA